MQIVIDVPDNMREMCRWHKDFVCNLTRLEINILAEAIINGIILPKNHGRLIDADELRNDWIFTRTEKIIIDDAPTIIEADKEVENDD